MMKDPDKFNNKDIEENSEEYYDEEGNLIPTENIKVIESQEELIDFLESQLKKTSKHKRETIDNRLAVSHTLDEFINSYILIGFDFDGNEVEIIRYNTNLDKMGLEMLLQKLITKACQKGI